MFLIRRLFAKVPEHNPALGVLVLLLACFTVAIQVFLPYQKDAYALLHLAVALPLFSEAAAYFLTDDQRPAKVKLRITEVIWLIFVVVPLFVGVIFDMRSVTG